MWCDNIMQSNGLLQAEVGDRGVKSRRRERLVDVEPGGVTADYVPFYYAPRSPMMYVISKGRVPEYQDGLDPLVYLVATPEHLAAAGCRAIISDGNCASALTEFSADLADLDRLVDWDLMAATMWKDTFEDGDRMRRRAAEFLVHQHVPWSAISAIATRTEPMLEEALAILGGLDITIPAKARPAWYY